MKKPVWIAGATLCGALLFGAGLLVGRQFPAHHFEKMSNSPYLYDTTTGSVCTYDWERASVSPPAIDLSAAFGEKPSHIPFCNR